MKLKSLCTVVWRGLLVVLHSVTSRLQILTERAVEAEARDHQDSCASAGDLPDTATRDLGHVEETRYSAACKSRKTDPASMSVDTHRGANQTCIRPEIFLEASPVRASEAHGQSTKYNPRVPWLARLIILGGCAYGPVLPMWYLSTTSIPAPIWLLLATQGWLAMSLGLLAWSWINGEIFSTNVKHIRR